jgi:hypothetical protein
MRIDPSLEYTKDTDDATKARVIELTRKAAIGLALLVELAIFYKMLT